MLLDNIPYFSLSATKADCEQILHDTMDQTICGWVEAGARLLVLAQDDKGEVYMQGNSQVVQGLEEDQEIFRFLKIKFYSAGAARWINEYRRVVVWPATWPVSLAQNRELLFQPSSRASQTFQLGRR